MSAVSPEDSVRVKASGARVTVRRMLDREGVLGALLVTPAVLIVVAFLALPIGLAFAMAFIRIDLTRSPDWTFFGLGNFLQIPIDPTFFGTVPRTLYFAVFATGLTAVTGSVTALFLNERFPGNRAMRVLVLLPWAVAPIATGVTWKLIFDYLYGLLNAVLFGLGLIPALRRLAAGRQLRAARGDRRLRLAGDAVCVPDHPDPTAGDSRPALSGGDGRRCEYLGALPLHHVPGAARDARDHRVSSS